MWHPDQIYAAEQARRAELVIRGVERLNVRGGGRGGAMRMLVQRLVVWAESRVRLMTGVRP